MDISRWRTLSPSTSEMYRRGRRHAASSALLVLFLITPSCGEDAKSHSKPVSDGQVSGAASEALDSAPEPEAGLAPDYKFIEVKVGDEEEVRFLAKGADLLRLAGGCDGKAPMSIGFQGGENASDSWRYFAFDSAEPVSVRQLGEIVLNRVTWDDGIVPHETLPVSVPNRYEGPGILTITRHEASLQGRRMEGTISAAVQNQSGELLPLMASFSVPLGCWSIDLD